MHSIADEHSNERMASMESAKKEGPHETKQWPRVKSEQQQKQRPLEQLVVWQRNQLVAETRCTVAVVLASAARIH